MPDFVRAFGDNLAATLTGGVKTLAVLPAADVETPAFVRTGNDNLAANDNGDGTKTLLFADAGDADSFVRLWGDNVAAVANAGGTKTLCLLFGTPGTPTIVRAGGQNLLADDNGDGTKTLVAADVEDADTGVRLFGDLLAAVAGSGAVTLAAGGGAASGPVAPAGAVFAAIAHPNYCASDAAHAVPCGDGDAIRWWKEAVTGVWYEQATTANRPILRDAGSGKWYAEHASVDHEMRFTGFAASVSTVLWASCAVRPDLTVGNDASPPWNTKPGAVGTIRGVSNSSVQMVDGTGNPTFTTLWTTTADVRLQAAWTQADGIIRCYRDGSALTPTSGTGGGTGLIDGPRVGGETGGGWFEGRNYGVVYFASSQVAATVDAFLLTLLPP